MIAFKLLTIAFAAYPMALPAVQQGSESNAPIIVPSLLSTKRAPYPLTCNGENVNYEEALVCYQNLRVRGNQGKMCGAEALCHHGSVYVSGSLWQTTDKKFKVNCGLVADAMNAIWGICKERGGSASIYQPPGWTQNRIDLLVIHLKNTWLMEPKTVGANQIASIDAPGAPVDQSVYSTKSPLSFAEAAPSDGEVTKREIAPYKTVCNNEDIKLKDLSYCRSYLNMFGDAEQGGCRIGTLCKEGSVRVNARPWETEEKDPKISCVHASRALDEIIKKCGSRGGELWCVS